VKFDNFLEIESSLVNRGFDIVPLPPVAMVLLGLVYLVISGDKKRHATLEGTVCKCRWLLSAINCALNFSNVRRVGLFDSRLHFRYVCPSVSLFTNDSCTLAEPLFSKLYVGEFNEDVFGKSGQKKWTL
jgi:hypothetical protein